MTRGVILELIDDVTITRGPSDDALVENHDVFVCVLDSLLLLFDRLLGDGGLRIVHYVCQIDADSIGDPQ